MSARRRQLRGLPISSGIVLGTSKLILPGAVNVAQRQVVVAQIPEELAALDRAVAQTIEELRGLRESAGKKIGGPVAKVFDAQLMIAGDSEFLNRVKDQIQRQRLNAGYVYNNLVEETIQPLSKSPDPYLRQMLQDIMAVSERILSHLAGYQERPTTRLERDTILIGQNFTPGDILIYRNRKAVGFVAGEGGASSHMALIARSLMMPLVVIDNSWLRIPDGSPLIVDGTSGTVIINPHKEELEEYARRRRQQGPASLTRLKKLPNIPPFTKDGEEVSIAANLELPGPADDILSSRKFPVGLYRTEFLYLEKEDFPDEETQYEFYTAIGETYSGSEVTLRTFDLGSDKIKADGLIPDEENPALGWRGIRSMLDMSGIFKGQVRAMLRASAHSKFKIMLPMISDVAEFDRARKLIRQVMLDLRRKNIPYDSHIQLGVMIEVPSAALTARQFAERADFLSIGSNDLTQYTMSADRNNARVATLYETYHPSVLQLIKMAVDAGLMLNKPVSVCGEIAGDPLAIPLLIGMGVRQLSMNPARIFDACRLVPKIDTKMARLLVGSVMKSGTTAQVKRRLESYRKSNV